MTDLQITLQAADAHARKVGHRYLLADEQRALDRGAKLLHTALDTGGNLHGRTAAYDEARRLI
ncbi:hypothetical protein [Streptomyces sp. GESEQ-35]|uniref:hypothetical protein n=1 Tax=Streptomyces sp. GESEQ-35 TaxID=2812657 RepID=UPI001B3329D4|nr:hypothetical protein [Streptomyces sp. GESEQ-35]